MIARAFTRDELDQFGCDTPGCPGDHPIYFFPRCHEAGASVSYDKASRQLIIACHICEQEIIRIAL